MKTSNRAGDRRTRRRLLADKLATFTVRGGGVAIIASIVAIVVFLIWEVLPLLEDAEVREVAQVQAKLVEPQALVADPYRTHIVGLGSDGQIRALDLSSGQVVATQEMIPSSRKNRGGLNPPGSDLLVAASDDGQLHSARVSWKITFPDSKRRVEPVEFMGELLAKAGSGSLSVDEETALQETLDMMSCRAAVKAGDRLNDVELTELLRRREEVERSSRCPHGRPTTLRLSLEDIEKQFGRR